MKEQPLTLAPSVHIVIATTPDLAHLAAWRRLWELLLAKERWMKNPSFSQGEPRCRRLRALIKAVLVAVGQRALARGWMRMVALITWVIRRGRMGDA